MPKSGPSNIKVTSKGIDLLDILIKKDQKNPPKEYENFTYLLIFNEKTGNYMAVDKFTKKRLDFIDGKIYGLESASAQAAFEKWKKRRRAN